MAEELSKPGLVEALGAGSGVLGAYDSAWRATENDKRDEVHPIRWDSVHYQSRSLSFTGGILQQ